MRAIALIVAVIGVFTLAIGIVFIFQAASAEQTIADQLNLGLKPLAISDVESAYDAASNKMVEMKAGVSSQQIAMNDYLTVVNQRTALGLTRSNLGVAQFTRIMGIINVVLGVSLVLVSLALLSARQRATVTA
jgi:hypothetical protein